MVGGLHQGQADWISVLRQSVGLFDAGVEIEIIFGPQGCFSILTMGESELGLKARTNLTARRDEYPVTEISIFRVPWNRPLPRLLARQRIGNVVAASPKSGNQSRPLFFAD